MQHHLTHSHVSETFVAARRSLRVAMVTESYPPEVNGVAQTVRRLVEGLRARNHGVQLVRPRQARFDTANTHDTPDEVLTAGMPIPMYGSLRLGLPCKSRLMRIWTKHRPDVVHIATEGPLGWSALQAALALKLPVCSDFRTNFQAYSRFYGAAWLQRPILAYLRYFHNCCHFTMVPTEALRQQLATDGFSPLAVVARGVDTQLFAPCKRNDPLRTSWGLGAGEVAVLHVGRLAAEKNLDVLVQAFEHIRVRQPLARLVVVGDGPERAALQGRCPDAMFTGFRTGEDLARCYASGDMFLFPSLTETFGNVTTEAMASGLPMVAFNDAAAGQLITNGRNGLIANKGDSGAFCRMAAELASNAALRQRLGLQARCKALELDWCSIVTRIEDLYEATMAKAHAARLPRVWPQVRSV